MGIDGEAEKREEQGERCSGLESSAPCSQKTFPLQVRMLSGETIILNASPSWWGNAVKTAMIRYLPNGSCVKQLISERGLVKDAESLAEQGLLGIECLTAIVGRSPPPRPSMWADILF